MMIAEKIKESLRGARIGGHCIYCNTICDASAVLAMRIDTSKFMNCMQRRPSAGHLGDRRKRRRCST